MWDRSKISLIYKPKFDNQLYVDLRILYKLELFCKFSMSKQNQFHISHLQLIENK